MVTLLLEMEVFELKILLVSQISRLMATVCVPGLDGSNAGDSDRVADAPVFGAACGFKVTEGMRQV